MVLTCIKLTIYLKIKFTTKVYDLLNSVEEICRNLSTNVHIGLLARPRKTTSGYDRKLRSPFYGLDLSFQIFKKGINLKLTIITEHFCQKKRYKNGINNFR